MKTCTNCKKNLPAANYSRHAASKDELNPQCKECIKAKRRKRTGAKPRLPKVQGLTFSRYKKRHITGIIRRERQLRAQGLLQ